MKVLAVLSFLLAVATSYPVVKTFTLSELSEAIETSKAEPGMMPYLEDALNQIMYAIFTGNNSKSINAVLTSPSGADTWTVEELTKAIDDPEFNQAYKSAVRQAFGHVQHMNESGQVPDSVKVSIPGLDVSTWTQEDLNEALKSPSTKADLIPHLEKAREELKQAQENGVTRNTIGMVTPVGLIPPKADYQYLIKPSKHIVKKTKKGL